MRVKIWASAGSNADLGPYRLLDAIERSERLSLGDLTPYGTVTSVLPPVLPFTEDADQSVVVETRPAGPAPSASEVIASISSTKYQRISILPIWVERNRFLEPNAFSGTEVVLAGEDLRIEDVSPFLGQESFSVWKRGCFLSQRDIERLEGLSYALTHRYPAESYRDASRDGYSRRILNLANACLKLIRPTRTERAGLVSAMIKDDGTIDPQSFALVDTVEVPMVQRLFSVRTQDVGFLREILPRFMSLYAEDEEGRIKDDYEPIRMAVQLYEAGYANAYWKARHLLWWSAIEALYGNAEDSVIARIYSFFGEKDLVRGYGCSIYEPGDIPSCHFLTADSNHTLGEVLPLMYEVRNSAAHGQKVADPHFKSVSHPFEGGALLLDVLAEAATFIIRKTVTEILKRDICDHFKDRDAREAFWLYKYGLNNRQSKKRLYELGKIRPANGAGA